MAGSLWVRVETKRPAAPTEVGAAGPGDRCVLGCYRLDDVLSTDAPTSQAPTERATAAHTHRRGLEEHLGSPVIRHRPTELQRANALAGGRTTSSSHHPATPPRAGAAATRPRPSTPAARPPST